MQTAENTPTSGPYEQLLIRVVALEKENANLREQLESYKRHLAWYEKQYFGRKSEKMNDSSFPEGELGKQLPLLNAKGRDNDSSSPDKSKRTITVPAHTRKERASKKDIPDNAGVSGLRFDSTVEIEEVDCPNPAVEGLSPNEYEIMGYDVVDKLCERKNGYFVRRYKRPKVKIIESEAIILAPAPQSVLPGSFMDVSFLTCMIIGKILFHLPIYRTHQRLLDGGIHVARSTLTNGFHAIGDLLQPVFNALLQSVLSSAVLTMDETPVKIGVDPEKHQMNVGHFWALYGDKDEVAFLSFDSRKHETVDKILGDQFQGVLLTDDYGAYQKFAAKRDAIIHALCWSHARRYFIDAQSVEPKKVNTTLKLIGGIYQVEKEIRTKELEAGEKLAYRTVHTAPKVDALFTWMKAEVQDPKILPKSPYRLALNYSVNNEQGLREFLSNPDIPVDTNHIERANKKIAIGKKNWLFCFSEIGGEYVALFHSLLYTARLHQVDPYEYLTDILMRVRNCPDKDLYSLTPLGWKQQRNKA